MKIGHIQYCIIWFGNIIYKNQVKCTLLEDEFFFKKNNRNRIAQQGLRVFPGKHTFEQNNRSRVSPLSENIL